MAIIIIIIIILSCPAEQASLSCLRAVLCVSLSGFPLSRAAIGRHNAFVEIAVAATAHVARLPPTRKLLEQTILVRMLPAICLKLL